jgi:hypothetical protein
MPKPTLKTVPSRSPARQELAAAIDRSRAAQDEMARLKATVDGAEAAVHVAEQDHQQAIDDLAAAREVQAQRHEAAVTQGHPPSRDDSVQEAKRRESDREEEVRTARSALHAITQKLDGATSAADQARDDVVLAARSVLADEIEPFFRETARMQAELIRRRLVLGFAVSSLRSSSERVSHSIWNEVQNFTTVTPPVEHFSQRYVYPELQPWRDALCALQADADVPLPTGAL